MTADNSRFTFDPDKRYTGVRQQQGRVHLDADWNEQVDIALHEDREARTEIIGDHGTRTDDPGFEMQLHGGKPAVGGGRYWVHGMRLENDEVRAIDDQPDFPGGAVPTDPGVYIAYLDVWERDVNAVQDPSIREPALGGADTTTRRRLVWQLKALRVHDDPTAPVHCMDTLDPWDRLVAGSTGTLEVRVTEDPTETNPCLVPSRAGYQGLTNQLYSVVVHAGNFDPLSADGVAPGLHPTFKWSRDNGSVVADWQGKPAALELTVNRLGPGGVEGFDPDTWVELRDDDDDLDGAAGILARILDAKGTTLTLDDPGVAVTRDETKHPLVRRWDSNGARPIDPAALDASERTDDDWIRIEKGVEVRFSGTGSFRTGDTWVIPARTAVLPGTEAHIEWPEDGGAPAALRPFTPKHHYARLGLLAFDGAAWSILEDCRHFFAAAIDGTSLAHAGGDGQEARPHTWLPDPLIVSVTRGRHPVKDALVRFRVVKGGGRVSDAHGSSGGPHQDVRTNEAGLAHCNWYLGDPIGVVSATDNHVPERGQVVEALLLDPVDPNHVPLRFTAVAEPLELEAAGGDGQIGWPGDELKVALRVRVTDRGLPARKARVRFDIKNRKLDGTDLDQVTGGFLHHEPSVGGQDWPRPGATERVSILVETDDDGVAQTQWVLGTEPDLPVQRVEATLLRDAVPVAGQRVLFTAHQATAAEIRYTPGCTYLTERLKQPDSRTVQNAIDLLCDRTAADIHYTPGCDLLEGELGPADANVKDAIDALCRHLEQVTARPPVVIASHLVAAGAEVAWPRSPIPTVHPPIDAVVLEFAKGLAGSATARRLQSAVTIRLEDPIEGGRPETRLVTLSWAAKRIPVGGNRPVHLTLAASSKGLIASAVDRAKRVLVRVEVRPSLLQGGTKAPFERFEHAFWVAI